MIFVKSVSNICQFLLTFKPNIHGSFRLACKILVLSKQIAFFPHMLLLSKLIFLQNHLSRLGGGGGGVGGGEGSVEEGRVLVRNK